MEENQMIMSGMLMKGSKGLYLSDGKKLYFPDRSFTDAEMGFVRNAKVVKDKGTYAFITGEMVRNVPMTDSTICDIMVEYGEDAYAFFQGKLLGTDVVVKYSKGSGEKPLVFIDGERFCRLEFVDEQYWVRENFCSLDKSLGTVISWLKDSNKCSTDELFLALVKLYAENSWVEDSVSIFDGKVINLLGSNTFYKCSAMGKNMQRVTAYSDKTRDEIIDYCLGCGETICVSRQDVCDWAKEHCIAFVNWGGYKNGTVRFDSWFNGNKVGVVMFGGEYLTLENFRENYTREVVHKSVETFESTLKRFGKMCTSRTIPELSKVMRSLKEWRGY